MRWLSRLQQLISGADSNTATRVEQSEYSRRTVRSVEVTVETDEVILQQTGGVGLSDSAPAEREPETSSQAGGISPTDQCEEVRSEVGADDFQSSDNAT